MSITKLNREETIRRLIADDLTDFTAIGGHMVLVHILRTGWEGYDNLTDDQLATEFADRELEA